MLIDYNNYEQIAVITRNIADKLKEIDFLDKSLNYYDEQTLNGSVYSKLRWTHLFLETWNKKHEKEKELEILKKALDKLLNV